MVIKDYIRTSILLSLLFAPAIPVWAASQNVTVLSAQGTVQVQEPGSSDWKPLASGAALAQGSRVSTGPGASCELAFAGEKNGTLRLKPSSSLLIKDLSENTQLFLDSGNLFTKLNKLDAGSKFQVNTPTAIATVRGTGWSQSSEKLEVFEGSIHVEGSGGEEMELFEGQSLEVDPSGGLGDVGAVSDESKSEWNDFSSSSSEAPSSDQEKTEEASAEEESLFAEEPLEAGSPDEGFREEVLGAQEDQQEIQQEEEDEKEDDHDDHGGGGQYTGGG